MVELHSVRFCKRFRVDRTKDLVAEVLSDMRSEACFVERDPDLTLDKIRGLYIDRAIVT